MSKMKHMVEEIVYMYRNGLPLERIAAACWTTVEQVQYCIDTYGPAYLEDP